MASGISAEETFLWPMNVVDRVRLVDLSSEPEPPHQPTCQKRQTGMEAVPSTGTRRCDMGRTWLWLVGLHTRKRRIDQ